MAPIIYLILGWFGGLWLASLWGLEGSVWLAGGAAGLVGVGLWRRFPAAGLALTCLGMVALGGWRYTTAVPRIDAAHIAYYNDSNGITLTGLVSDEPDIRDRFVNLRLAAESITLRDGTIQPVTGLVLVRTLRFPVIDYGTRLRLNGRLETPPENEEFSYKAYLARQGIHSLMAMPAVETVAIDQGKAVYAAIFRLKHHAQATIQRLIPEPQAALLTGILLGNDNGLPPDLAEAFRTTGMTHIIAISGFNISLLIGVFVWLAERLAARQTAVWLAILGVVFYTILVGANPSVVRAALMGSVYLFTSRILGRPNYSFASLFLAGFAMTLLNPFALWDVGFQLSFMATLGLMLYGTPFTQWTRQRLLRWFDAPLVEQTMGWLSEAVLITLAAQVLTLPLMLAYFGQLSLVSLLANALILPAQPGVMVWGGLATLVGLAAPAIAQPLAWVAELLLAYTIWLVRALATLPLAAVPVSLSTAGLITLYALIALLTWLAKQEPERRWTAVRTTAQTLLPRAALGSSVVLALLTARWGLSQPDGRLHVAFLNVGQGDAVFIQTPSGRQMLVDGGYYPSILNDQLGRQMPFGDKEIDFLVATHPDADHVSGLVGVFERYRVGQLFTDGEGLGQSPIYDAVLQAAEAADTPIRAARVGEVLWFEDGVRIEVVHPGLELDEESRNENSVSLRLVYGRFALLLTGDAETRAEEAMLARGLPLQATVFKAGHHGSRTSSSLPFLQAVNPDIVIISAGADNRFGHPHPEVLERVQAVGAVTLRTDELGTIRLVTDGEQVWLEAQP